jgi:hypothetical protein
MLLCLFGYCSVCHHSPQKSQGLGSIINTLFYRSVYILLLHCLCDESTYRKIKTESDFQCNNLYYIFTNRFFFSSRIKLKKSFIRVYLTHPSNWRGNRGGGKQKKKIIEMFLIFFFYLLGIQLETHTTRGSEIFPVPFPGGQSMQLHKTEANVLYCERAARPCD